MPHVHLKSILYRMIDQFHPIASPSNANIGMLATRAGLIALLLSAKGIPVQGQMPTYEWSRSIDAALSSTQVFYNKKGVRMDDAGNAYVFSAYAGTPDMDPGPAEVLLPERTSAYLVAKYSDAGTLLWAIALGSSNSNAFEIMDLAIDEGMGRFALVGTYSGPVDIDPGAGSVVMVPSTSSSCKKSFIALYDLDGNYLSHMTLGTTCSAQVELAAAAFTPGHRLVVGGEYFGTPDVDPIGTLNLPNGEDPFAAQYSIPFSLDWAAPINAQFGRVYGAAVSASGQVALVGRARGSSVDFDPGPGQSQTNIGSNGSAFGALYASDGSFLWAHRLASGAGQSTGLDVGFDPEGDLYFQGTVSYTTPPSPFDLDPGPGTASFLAMGTPMPTCCNRFVLKLTNAGTYAWARMVWTNQLQEASEANHIALLDQAIVVGGSTTSSYAYRTFQAPGGVWAPLPDCEEFNSSHYLTALDRNTGEVQWILFDTVNCSNGFVDLQGLDTDANGAIVLLGQYGDLMDGSLGLDPDLLDGQPPVSFLSRFQAGDITTAVSNLPHAASVNSPHVLSTTLTDLGGRLVHPGLPRALDPADLRGLPPGIYLVTERMSDGTIRTRRTAWME